jgi:hypothetical protein
MILSRWWFRGIVIALVAVMVAGVLFMMQPRVSVELGEGRVSISLDMGVAYASPDWVSPTGHDDPDSEWGNEAQIYDDDTETLGYCNSSGHYLYLTLTSPISCDKVRSWWDTSSGDANVEIWVYYSEGWHKIHDGVITKGEWVETSIGSTQTVEKAGIALNISTLHYFYEFDFNEVAGGCTEDITNTPSAWSVNSGSPVETSSEYTTGLTHFTVTNNSGGAVDITISGTDMAGGGYTWTLSDTATAGDMTFGLKAGLSGGDYTIIVKKNSPFNALVSGLADEGTQDWGLKLYTPTLYDDGYTKTGTVTITATCS